MKRVQFPVRIKRGSAVVTIYRTPAKGYNSFTVAHYATDGKRCRKTFADYSIACRAARDTATSLAGGNSDMLVLTGEALLVYRRAQQALQVTGTPLDTAAVRFAELAQNKNDSQSQRMLAPAHSNGETANPKLVGEVLNELLVAKKEKGRSQLHLTDLRIRLKRFADAFPRPLGEITATDIDGFLGSLEVAARSKNNFRATIGSLFRFGQSRGYVTREHPGVSNVEKASYTNPEIQIFTPEEIKKLLSKAKPELIPVLVLGAFAGIRSEEIKRILWADIKFKQRHIEIKTANSKTKIRRLIDMQKNLKAWLRPFAAKTGPVAPFSNLALQFGKLAKRSGVKWRKNGLRHSFISYRVAQIRNVPQVALEAGNSPAIVARNYLKYVTAAEARRWFKVYPPSSGTGRAHRTG